MGGTSGPPIQNIFWERTSGPLLYHAKLGLGGGKDIIHTSSKESEHLRLKVKTKLKITSKTQQFFIKDVLNNKTNCKTLSVNQSNYFLLVDLVNACRRAKGLLLLFFLYASHIGYSFSHYLNCLWNRNVCSMQHNQRCSK